MTTNRWLRALLVAVLAACSDNTTEVVVPEVSRVDVAPGDRVLTVGDTMRLTAYPVASDGTVLGSAQVTWESADADVASITSNGIIGRVQARAPGTVRIGATADGVTGSVLVTVVARQLEMATITLSPDAAFLTAGATQNVEAVLRAADGTPIGGRPVTWHSSNPQVATITSVGNVAIAHVTALRGGETIITASSEGVQATMRVQVQQTVPLPAPVAFVSVTPYVRSVWVDHMVSYGETTRALGANGLPLAGRTITFSVSDSTIASVNAVTGQVRGRRPGVVKVRATSEGKTGEAELHVFPTVTGVVTYAQTHDWWDGQVRIAEDMGSVTWTDSAGVQRSAQLSLFGGSLTIDHGVYPYTYERVLRGEAYAHVNGALRKVAERSIVDRGTMVMSVGANGAPYMQFTSTSTPGLAYRGDARGHGEILLRTDVGAGRIVDVLFRQRP